MLIRKQRITGDYTHVAFCDSDDIWEPEHLAKSLITLAKEQADMTCTTPDFISDKGEKMQPYGIPIGQDPTFENILANNSIYISSVVMRRNIISSVGYFDPTFDGIEDWDYWVRVLKAGYKIAFNPSVITITYLIREGSAAGKITNELINKLKGKYMIIEKIPDAINCAGATPEVYVHLLSYTRIFRICGIS